MTTLGWRATGGLVLVALLVVAPAEAGDRREPRFGEERRVPLHKALDTERVRQKIVGLAVAVIEDGALVHVHASGFADRETLRPIDENTVFRWASVAKILTAVAALQLVESGRMDLDKPARTYWKTLPKEGLGAVPIDALLRMQGGVGHYAQMGNWKTRLDKRYGHRNRKPFDAAATVEVMQTPPLLFEPYAKYHYTTFGYNLLGALIEKAGAMPFERQVELRIAKRLGMTTLEPDYAFEKRPNRTLGYRMRGETIVASSEGDVSWKLPGGGFQSTVGDMGRLGVGLLGTKLLGRTMRRALTEVRKPAQGTTSYALGIGVSTRDGVITRLSHTGAQARTRTLLIVEPPTGRGIAIMANSEWARLGDVYKVASRALGW